MRYAILAVGLTIISMLVMEFNARTTELNQLTVEQEIVQTELAQKQQTKAALEAQIAIATSDAAVIRWAHEDGHMVKDGEIPVVPIPAGSIPPTPTPTPVPVVEESNNQNSWLVLILGAGSP